MQERTIDLSAFPEEVTNYAFDQLDDRVYEALRVNGSPAETVRALTDRDYDAQELTIHHNPVEHALLDAINEKLTDIEYEVRHGERDDYTLAKVRALQREVDEVSL